MAPKTEHRLFAYGTLLDAARQEQLLGRACATQKAVLRGYCLCAGRWPYIVPQAGGHVGGAVLEALSDEDMERLDAYEDIGKDLYRRNRVDVTFENGHTGSCWVYLPVLKNWGAEWLEEGT